MANEYRSYFGSRNNRGESKDSFIKSFHNWDEALHPEVKILNLTYTPADSCWMVNFNEQNDFSKLIGYPGWKGSMCFRFNANKLISETVYIPDQNNRSYAPWLKPAVEWLEINRPEEFKPIYVNKKLVRTYEAASKWKELLKVWKNSTKTN